MPYDTTPTSPPSERRSSSLPETQAQPSSSTRSFRDTFRTGTPDEVRDHVRDAVAKGVAAISGALSGFTESARREDVPGRTKRAIRTVGETASETIHEVGEKAKEIEPRLKETGQKLASTARDVKQTAKREMDKTREAFRGGSTMETSGYGSSSIGRRERVSDLESSSGDMTRSKSRTLGEPGWEESKE